VIYSGINSKSSEKNPGLKKKVKNEKFDRPLLQMKHNVDTWYHGPKAAADIFLEYYTANNHINSQNVSFFSPYLAKILMERFPGKVFSVRTDDFNDKDINVICAAHILAKNKVIPEDFDHYIYTTDPDYNAYSNFSGKFSKFTIINYRLNSELQLEQWTSPPKDNCSLKTIFLKANGKQKMNDIDNTSMTLDEIDFYISFLESALSGFTKYHDDIGLRFINEEGSVDAFEKVKVKLALAIRTNHDDDRRKIGLDTANDNIIIGFKEQKINTPFKMFVSSCAHNTPITLPLHMEPIINWIDGWVTELMSEYTSVNLNPGTKVELEPWRL
jgi:hypothetical protein